MTPSDKRHARRALRNALTRADGHDSADAQLATLRAGIATALNWLDPGDQPMLTVSAQKHIVAEKLTVAAADLAVAWDEESTGVPAAFALKEIAVAAAYFPTRYWDPRLPKQPPKGGRRKHFHDEQD
jgi:hypothetical protein